VIGGQRCLNNILLRCVQLRSRGGEHRALRTKPRLAAVTSAAKQPRIRHSAHPLQCSSLFLVSASQAPFLPRTIHGGPSHPLLPCSPASRAAIKARLLRTAGGTGPPQPPAAAMARKSEEKMRAYTPSGIRSGGLVGADRHCQRALSHGRRRRCRRSRQPPSALSGRRSPRSKHQTQAL
jgi:hypothetical protein